MSRKTLPQGSGLSDGDDMKREELHRIRAFVMSADMVLNAIPRPVPPRPPDGWMGKLLDTNEMYRSYSRLPSEIQEMAAPGYYLCMQALERQGDTATLALIARYKLFLDIMNGTGLKAAQLAPLNATERMRADRHLTLVVDDEEPDLDAEAAEAIQEDIDVFLRQLFDSQSADEDSEEVPVHGASEDGDDADVIDGVEIKAAVAAPEVESLADAGTIADRANALRTTRRWAFVASAVATAAVVALLCHTTGDEPVARNDQRTVDINQSAKAGDLTVVVSHSNDKASDTEVNLHLVNTGDEPKQTELTLRAGENTATTGPIVILAGETRHEVMAIPRDTANKAKNFEITTLGINGITETSTIIRRNVP